MPKTKRQKTPFNYVVTPAFTHPMPALLGRHRLTRLGLDRQESAAKLERKSEVYKLFPIKLWKNGFHKACELPT